MFKLELKCEDYFGNTITENLKFNLSETEMIELVDTNPIFNAGVLNAMAADERAFDMYKAIRELILLSYGELSEDGRHFRKSKEITNDFKQSVMYEAVVDKLMEDESGNAIKEFVYGIFPAKFAKEMRERTKDGKISLEDFRAMNK